MCPQLKRCMGKISLTDLWLLHLRAYPLLGLPCLFCSSSLYRAVWVGERAKHCFLLGFIPGLDIGEGGMLQTVDVTSHFSEHVLPYTSLFFSLPFPKPYQAHDPSADNEIWDEGQEWLKYFSADFQPWTSGFPQY